jgi:ABC-type dipeptide/oligopeptide/nickel transport system ATPase component
MTLEFEGEKQCREFLKYIFDIVIKNQKPPKNKDSIFLICGSEGSGKSYFEMYCMELIGEMKKQKIENKQITGNLRDFLLQLKHSQKGEVMALDEGGELASTEQMNKVNKKMTQVFRAIREKSFLIFICFTNPLKINTYFKEDRVRGVFFIPKNGEIRYFTQQRFTNIILPKILKDGIKSINAFKSFSPDFRLNNFPLYNGYMKKEYKKFKQTTMNEIIDSALMDVDSEREGLYNITEASRMLDVDKKTVYSMIKRGEIISQVHPVTKRQYIKEEALQIILDKNTQTPHIPRNPKIKSLT